MDSRSAVPLVSIGLPVRNGEQYLREAIDSLLSQTYRGFELIICDDASDDRTQQICREYAARDGRIRYYRSEHDIGGRENFNRAFHLSRGRYFKWAVPDDLCESQLLEECVRALEADSTAAMAFTGTRVIDSDGNVIASDRRRPGTDSPSPVQRYRALIFAEHRPHTAFEAFGLYRRSVLGRSNLFDRIWRAESALFVRCALMGRFIRIDGDLSPSRDRNSRLFRAQPKPMERESVSAGTPKTDPTPPLEWWDAPERSISGLPECVIAREYLRAISQTPLSRMQKRLCRLWWALFVARHASTLTGELLVAAQLPFMRALSRRGRLRLGAEHQSRADSNLAQAESSEPRLDVSFSTPHA
jgi:hypothetical protein